MTTLTSISYEENSPSKTIKRWNQYYDHNPRAINLATLWVKDLSHHLTNHHKPKGKKILDYGCGHFSLGSILADAGADIHGFDPNPKALALAHTLLPKAILFEERTLIQACHYDLIVVHSVVQYFSGEEELRNFLLDCKKWLDPKGDKQMIISDIIGTTYNKYLDAWQNLLFAFKHSQGLNMAWHLFKAARAKSAPHKLLQIDVQRMTDLAKECGFNATLFSENLSPSRQRYSMLLVRVR